MKNRIKKDTFQDKKIKNNKILIIIGLVCVVLVVFIGSGTLFLFYKDVVNDWITMMVSLIGSLVGGVLTMVGVILTLNSNYDSEETIRRKKIYKLSLIILNEFEAYKSFSSKCLENYILNTNLEIIHKEKLYTDFEDQSYEYPKPYEMISNIKELIYELILLSTDPDKCNDFLEFYNAYKDQIESFNQQGKIKYVSDIFDKEYKKLDIIQSNSTQIDDEGNEHNFCFSIDDIKFVNKLQNIPPKLSASSSNALLLLKHTVSVYSPKYR